MSSSRINRRHHLFAQSTRPQHHSDTFVCVQCQQTVMCAPRIAGVQNRNHCPACLWSRHLDSRAAGDRLSACRAAMQPIGLTTKRSRNKYAQGRDGELMLIHRCTRCATIIINRIAADDSAAALLEVFEESWAGGATVAAELAERGVELLTIHDHDLVRQRLFGERLINAQLEAV